LLRFLRLTFATWRVTSLLVQERAPYALSERLRERLQGTEAGKALDCIWCTSIWVAGLILIADRFCPQVVDLLALSAGAILYDKHITD
jgi:hypothetical protein